MLLMWIGKYQSDIAYLDDYFNGSITYYGDGQNSNQCCCPPDIRTFNKKAFIAFIIDNIKKGLGKYNYIFYNQSYAYEIIKLFPECKNYIRNINTKELVNWLSNKTLVRLWVKNIVKVPPFCATPGNECTIPNLTALFPNHSKFVIQENYSSGGIGSIIIERNNSTAENSLNKSDIYLVSPMIENSFSINIHLLIGQQEQITLPISIQIIEPDQSPYIFRGSDFIASREISEEVIKKLHICAKKIGEKLADMGYRGVCGLDFLIQEEDIYFIEINPRFQGSSFLINRALKENLLPSIYELNDMAFANDSFSHLRHKLENLLINYSYYKVKCSKQLTPFTIKNYLKCTEIDSLYMDGLNLDNSYLQGYLFRFISKHNLVSINFNNRINIYQNLLMDQPLSIQSNDLTSLKTSLLIHGIRIDSSAKIALKDKGGFQEGTFDAIDIYFSSNIVINCPLKIPYIDYSPYTLTYQNGNFKLLVYDKSVSIVNIDKKDNISHNKTHSGLPYTKLIQRNNDRIRIRHNSVCSFKQKGKGCYFCHAKNEDFYTFDLKDIEESFLFYLYNIDFNQIMIGGASNDRQSESTLIKDIIYLIRKYTCKSIYIMSIPPTNFNDICEYKRLGADEIAFNMEIFDEQTARTIMPGKGLIPRSEYLKALEKAVGVFGNNGEVRSMLIVGLESLATFKEGVELLCKIGVSPMISPFRPMLKTKMEHFVPPNLAECQRYFDAALTIASKYNVSLGPSNKNNQNNTLNFVSI